LGSLNHYWNRRLDPLDWKRVQERHDPARWREAHRTFLDPATADAIAALGEVTGKRLLEIGCGQGHGTQHLIERGAHVTGIDISDRRCRVARDQTDAGASFCAADAERLPFPDEAFEFVFCRDVLMYADPDRVLRECHRILRSGGRAVFVESLEGPALLRWFRRWTSPADYREFTRHLSWSRIRALGAPLEPLGVRPYYLTSLAAFACLFLFRSSTLHRLALSCLAPVDRLLFDRLGFLSHAAWRATAIFGKGR